MRQQTERQKAETIQADLESILVYQAKVRNEADRQVKILEAQIKNLNEFNYKDFDFEEFLCENGIVNP